MPTIPVAHLGAPPLPGTEHLYSSASPRQVVADKGLEKTAAEKAFNKTKKLFQKLITGANYIYYSSISFTLANSFSVVSMATSSAKLVQQVSIFASVISSGLSLVFESLHLRTAVKLSDSPFLRYNELTDEDKAEQAQDLPALFVQFCEDHNLVNPDSLEANLSKDPIIKALKTVIRGKSLTALSDALNLFQKIPDLKTNLSKLTERDTGKITQLSKTLHTQVQKRKLFLTISLITLTIFFIGALLALIASTYPISMFVTISFVLWWGGWGLNIITNFIAKGYLAKKGWKFSFSAACSETCPTWLKYSATKVSQATTATFKHASQGCSALASFFKSLKILKNPAPIGSVNLLQV